MERIFPITEINDSLLEALSGLMAELGAQLPQPRSEQLRRMILSPNTRLLVAQEGDKIVGMTTIAWYDTLSARRGWIEDVVVSPELRGRGLGRKLIQAAKAWALEAGIESLSLTSAPHRIAARSLYQKEGFEPVQTGLFRLKF